MTGYKKLLVYWTCRKAASRLRLPRGIWRHIRMRPWLMLHVVEFVPVEPMGESLMPTVRIGG